MDLGKAKVKLEWQLENARCALLPVPHRGLRTALSGHQGGGLSKQQCALAIHSGGTMGKRPPEILIWRKVARVKRPQSEGRRSGLDSDLGCGEMSDVYG